MNPAETAATATDQPPAESALAADKQELVRLLTPLAPDMLQVELALDRITSSTAGYVHGLVEHVRSFGGKRLRPALVFLGGRAVNPEAVGETHARVAAVVELIHTATLVHDDILDGAVRRRMRLALHRMEGTEVAVLLGDFLLASAYAEAAALADPLASRYLSQITRLVCQGEVLQVHERGNLDLARETYLEIIEKKTAVLYAASCEVGARYAGASETQVKALHDYGMGLGMAFQIADDVLDLTGDEEVVGKSLGTDLARAKLTLPLIHFFETGPAADVARAREVLAAGRGAEEASSIRAAVRAAGSIEFARCYAEERIARAVAALDALDESPARDTLIALSSYVLERRR